MEVTYSVMTIRGLKAMPKADAKRIRDGAIQVAEIHPQRKSFVSERVGRPNAWRLKEGDWRALFEITGDELIVVAVGLRGNIYDR